METEKDRLVFVFLFSICLSYLFFFLLSVHLYFLYLLIDLHPFLYLQPVGGFRV